MGPAPGAGVAAGPAHPDATLGREVAPPRGGDRSPVAAPAANDRAGGTLHRFLSSLAAGGTAAPRRGSEVLLARQRRVALDRLVEDLLGLGGAAPAVELDPLALLQVLVVLEEVADSLEIGRASCRERVCQYV